jgi:hypothetical protein
MRRSRVPPDAIGEVHRVEDPETGASAVRHVVAKVGQSVAKVTPSERGRRGRVLTRQLAANSTIELRERVDPGRRARSSHAPSVKQEELPAARLDEPRQRNAPCRSAVGATTSG